jgi:hypothetical protein
MPTLIDSKRLLIELAINAGRHYESPRTGLIHYCYEEKASDTIPYYENICFCLSLFRSCFHDHILEAQEKLGHLLAFDTFPTYLHEYPLSGKTQRLYFPLYWINKLFSSVIKEPIRTRLKEALAKILPFPKPKEIRSSKDAASLCLHLQLEDKSLHPLASYWDPKLALYIGPLLEERQRKNTPEVTLFDLYMAAATGQFSKRLLKHHPVHMHAALIFPTKAIDPILKRSTSSYLPTNPSKGFHHFRRAWEGRDGHLHTFVCQEKRVLYHSEIFTYSEEIPDERNRQELTFYCDYHPDVVLKVNNEKATVFHIEDCITIETPNKTLKLSFKILEGEGTFMGQISRGNRPAQIETKSDTAYDWKISMRTIRRTPKLKLSLLLE